MTKKQMRMVWLSADAENAFWDEFIRQEEKGFGGEEKDYSIRLVDDVTGEEWEFDGLVSEREVLELD